MEHYLISYHKNVVLYFIMSFADKINEKITKIYAAQLISGVEYLQKNKIMHRDLKPQNVLLDADWNLKIVSVFKNFTNQ